MKTISVDTNHYPPQLLTIESARLALGLSRSRLYELIRLNVVRSVRLGPRGLRVPASEIARIEREGLQDS